MRRNSFSGLLPVLALSLLALLVNSAPAAVQNRISGTVSGSTRVVIPNTVHSRARLATDLGAAPASTKLQNMTLRFSLTDAQQTALDQLLANQQNPSSSSYHQWLTPAQYGAQFGLSSADLAKVTAWLTSQGFTIDEVSKSSTFVRFSGTAAQVNAAFSTTIHNVQMNGVVYYANLTDVSVPAALGGVVSGVTGLHNFKLKPHLHTRTVKFTSSISGDHYIAPADFYTIYNETPSLQSGLSGAGVTVAIMGQVDISQTDISAFRSASGLSASTVTVQLYGTDPGTASNCSSSTDANCPTPNLDDLDESSLDVEWSGATAPGASILFVTSTDVLNISLTEAIDNNLAPIMSVSYGDCEAAWGTADLTTFNQLFKQANSQGITVVGPGGDDGATDCDYSDTSATQGLAVDFPASSPYVTGMGGSMYNEGSATGGTTYWANSSSASSGGLTLTAGSYVSNAPYSALGYIPEAVWNEDTAGSTFSAGGGGVSQVFSKPAWQVGTFNDASRDVPDLALDAAAVHDGYLYCVSGTCVNGFRYTDQTLNVAGGTSFAAPTFAGILALVEQKTGSRIGNANPTIYALANNTAFYNSTSASAFHDITTGNNDSPCTADTPNCPNGGSIGYSAAAGYDLATGWGSVNVYNLVNGWNTVTPLGVGSTGSDVSSTVVTASPTSVAAGANVTFTAVVSGSSGTPTGTVQFLVNNAAVGSPVTLSGGTASYTYATSCSNLGQLIVAASYSGDGTYAGSVGAGITTAGSSNATQVQVNVTSGSCPDFSLTPSASTVSVTSGNPTATITVTSVNNLAGTVTFTASATETSSTVPTVVFSPTSVTLTADGKATTTLTLSNVTALLHPPAGPSPNRRTPWYAAGSGVTLAGLLMFVTPRRRRLGTILVALLAFGAIAGLTGCGSQSNGVINASTTERGTYTVTVTGTYSGSSNNSISQSTTINFDVQ